MVNAYEIPVELAEIIRDMARPPMRTLETGSGKAGQMFRDIGCDHLVMDCQMVPPPGLRNIILINGIAEDDECHGILPVIDDIANRDTIFLINGTHRNGEWKLMQDIAFNLRFRPESQTHYTTDEGHGYSILRHEEPER